MNLTAVIMDNGVYGLTKGQSSPTTEMGTVTSSTPFGKVEEDLDPLELYLTLGVSFIASGFSGQPRVLARLINEGMNHDGMSMIHVQSPCVTYNDTYQLIKGNAKRGHRTGPVGHTRRPRSFQQAGGLRAGATGRTAGWRHLQGREPSLAGRQHGLDPGQGPRSRSIDQLMNAYAF